MGLVYLMYMLMWPVAAAGGVVVGLLFEASYHRKLKRPRVSMVLTQAFGFLPLPFVIYAMAQIDRASRSQQDEWTGDLILYGISALVFTLMVANTLAHLERPNWWRLPSAWAILAGSVFLCGGSKPMVFGTLGVPVVIYIWSHRTTIARYLSGQRQ